MEIAPFSPLKMTKKFSTLNKFRAATKSTKQANLLYKIFLNSHSKNI